MTESDTDRLRGIVLDDLQSTDDGARAAFGAEFGGELVTFAEATTTALQRWHEFMDSIPEEASRQLTVAAIMFTALNQNIMSFKLFMTGYTVASGGLFRQVLEGVSLALVCSAKSLTVLDRFIANKFRPTKQLATSPSTQRRFTSLEPACRRCWMRTIPITSTHISRDSRSLRASTTPQGVPRMWEPILIRRSYPSTGSRSEVESALLRRSPT